jgi:capsular polysaccharide biosynthesis protein
MSLTEWLLLLQTIVFFLTGVIVFFYTRETYKGNVQILVEIFQ